MSRIILLIVTLSIGCAERGSLTPYVRLSGPAPVMARVAESRAVLVAFWATWCPPCREETVQLRALAVAPPDGLRVVVVSQDEDASAIGRFFGGAPPPELQLRLDSDQQLYNGFRIDKLPASVLVVDGQLVARFDGARDWDGSAMRLLLRRLIAESETAVLPRSTLTAPATGATR